MHFVGEGREASQRAPNPPEFARPRLSRVKGRSSPARGYKFGCVCSYMAGVISHQRNDWPYRNKHTQICTLSLGMTALCQNRLQWGRSNLVDPAEGPKIGLLNRDFGSIFSVFLRKKSKTQSSLNVLQSGPRKFGKSDFFGIGPDPAGSDFDPTQTGLCKFGRGFGAR